MGDPVEVLRDWLGRHGRTAEFRQTHASVVAISGDRVYKMKKPVRFPFLDLSTRGLRRRVCEREIELNRRLAPDVYLGLVDVTDPAGQLVDHAVEMVRLPDDHRLDQLLDDPAGAACLHRLADLMAQFHAQADRSPQLAAAGSVDAVARLWDEGFAGVRQFVGDLLDPEAQAELERLARRYVAGRAALFRQRAPRVVDGHGDLRADDVFCLPDGLRVIDCLEFDDRLRHGDALADVAFLAMDLEWLGHPELARRFLDSYRAADGDWPASLEHHWIAYRAHVRCKVACLRTAAGGHAEDSARGHLALALRHLRAAQVRLVLVGGLPGTGKSTLARGLADGWNFVLVRSDVVRRELPVAELPSAGFGTGRYSQAAKDEVYAALLARARTELGLGASVVLDASWSDAGHRHAAAQLATTAGAELVALQCVVDPDTAARRITARAATGTDESEADVAIARAMAARWDPWPEATTISTDVPVADVVDRAAGAAERAIG